MIRALAAPYPRTAQNSGFVNKVDPAQKRILLLMQCVLLIPYFQISSVLPFVSILVGAGLLQVSSYYVQGRARLFMASGYAALGALGLLVLYGWRDISAISLFFLIVGLAKLVEINSHRDTVFQICLIVIQTVFVLLLSPVFTTFVLSLIQMTGISMILLNARQFSLSGSLKIVGILASAIPLTVVFFLFFPRFNANLFDLGMMVGLPGAFQLSQGEPTPLNDSVGFDDIAAKSGSDVRVLIADFYGGVGEFHDGIPPLDQLYWRGPVLWQYENNQWLPREGWNKRANRMRGKLSEEDIYKMVELKGKLTAYSVTLFPSNSYWTYALNIPTRSAASTYVTKDFQLLNLNPVRNVLQYHMSSYLGYEMKHELAEEDRILALQKPVDRDPRLKIFAEEIRADTPDDIEFANKLLKYFHEGFAYDPGKKSTGKIHAMDIFLFEEKLGNSAHFASAFAMMMRHADIPTRLVAGYRGGNVVGLTEKVLILENSAYVWAESWFENRGWVRIDPAMPVAGPPGTSTGGGGWGLAGNASEDSDKAGKRSSKNSLQEKNTARQPADPSASKQERLAKGLMVEEDANWFDTFQSDWVSWLNNFDANIQKESFLENTENVSKRNWLDLLKLLGGGALIILLGVVLFLSLFNFRKRRNGKRDEVRYEFQKFRKLLENRNVELPKIENIEKLQSLIMSQSVKLGEEFSKVARDYVKTYALLRYGSMVHSEKINSVKELRAIRKRLESAR
ncbi:MAG: DUF3488 and transglutaminase-like domain-containing protein [Sneathiellales bacterium]|nr:DUF3488 and transglutaminase-like domain-containing protein [Sneathiellales bacterium]